MSPARHGKHEPPATYTPQSDRDSTACGVVNPRRSIEVGTSDGGAARAPAHFLRCRPLGRYRWGMPCGTMVSTIDASSASYW